MKTDEVIKVESLEHGQKVKKYFESLGIDTSGMQFSYVDWFYGVNKTNNVIYYPIEHVRHNNLKIIKLPKEYAYPKVMTVSHYEDFTCEENRVVFMEKNNKYIAWRGAETIKDSETKTCTVCWEYAKDIEHETIVELTLQDISDGKGTGIPTHLIRIKE